MEPSKYFPVLTEGLPFPQALDALLDGLVQTLVLTEAEQSAEKEIEEITLAYGNGTLTDNMDALPFIAAAFAAKTGKTADELTEVDLTAKELSVLRTVFGAMSAVSCTLMETDMTDGTLNDETGEPNVIKTKYALSFKILLSRSASALLVTAEEQERYQALCTGDEWDKLLSLWRGYGWVGVRRGGEVYTLREDVVRLALAQQGRIEYLWGGKYNNLGRSPFWGFPQQNENGEIFTDGLDCSGFVTGCCSTPPGRSRRFPPSARDERAASCVRSDNARRAAARRSRLRRRGHGGNRPRRHRDGLCGRWARAHVPLHARRRHGLLCRGFRHG